MYTIFVLSEQLTCMSNENENLMNRSCLSLLMRRSFRFRCVTYLYTWALSKPYLVLSFSLGRFSGFSPLGKPVVFCIRFACCEFVYIANDRPTVRCFKTLDNRKDVSFYQWELFLSSRNCGGLCHSAWELEIYGSFIYVLSSSLSHL